MLKIAKPNVTPPGGYRYVDPDTSHPFKAGYMRSLIDQVVQHRRANKLEPLVNPQAVIEDWICQRCPAGVCKDDQNRIVRHGMPHRTANTAVKATSLLRRLSKKSSGKPPTQTEAEARAEICSLCRMNIAFAGCMSCRGVTSVVKEWKLGLTTPFDNRLQACGICGVLNEIHVFIDNKTIIETTDNIGPYPESCWKRPIVEGARKDGYTDSGSEEGTSGSRSDQTPRTTVVRKTKRRPRLGHSRRGSRTKSCGGCGKSRKKR